MADANNQDRQHAMKILARSEFEAWADTYDESWLHRFMFQPAYRMFLEEIYSWRGRNGRPFSLLDIGCGTGQFGAMLAISFPNARITGLDYAEGMCKAASRKAAETGIVDRLNFVTADSEHLPFTDRSFDIVTCSNSFHHYPHQRAVVHDIVRVLRPEGRLMLIDGFRDNIVGWFVFDVVIGRVEKEVFHAPWSTIHRYFEEAGFHAIRRRKFNYWFPLLLTVGTAGATPRPQTA